VNQKEGAKQLVERARAGDQNAMDTLYMVGHNARLGNPTAKSAFGLIQKFISENPAKEIKIGFGAEEKKALGVIKEQSNDIGTVLGVLFQLPMMGSDVVIPASCVILSFWPNWTKGKVAAIESNIGADAERNLFHFGIVGDPSQVRPIAKKLPPEAIGLLCAGHCIGTARKIQFARLPNVPPKVLSDDIGWELGCR
jgi:hypothetical protein